MCASGRTENEVVKPYLAALMPARPQLGLVSYDLDGTLIDGTAFLLVARRLGLEAEVLLHDRRFRAGEITLEECFDIEFRLLAGRRLAEVEEALEHGTWFPGIREGVRMLKEAGLDVLLLTDNPDFIARHTERFGIMTHLASRGIVLEGKITGEVFPSFDKWERLRSHLAASNIDPQTVVHIGNDVNDVRVWEHVGLGVCVEPTGPAVAQAADIVIPKITDHRDIAQAILEAAAGRKAGADRKQAA